MEKIGDASRIRRGRREYLAITFLASDGEGCVGIYRSEADGGVTWMTDVGRSEEVEGALDMICRCGACPHAERTVLVDSSWFCSLHNDDCRNRHAGCLTSRSGQNGNIETLKEQAS